MVSKTMSNPTVGVVRFALTARSEIDDILPYRHSTDVEKDPGGLQGCGVECEPSPEVDQEWGCV